MSVKLKWDEEIFKLEDIRRWVSSCFEDKPEVGDPIEILHVKDWGITASFKVEDNVFVFKGSTMDLFVSGALVDELLARHCPEHVGELVKAATWKTNIWTLYKAFNGQTLALNKKNLEDLADVAVDIQNKTAYAYDRLIFQLKHTTLTSIAHHVHRVQEYVQEAKASPEIIRTMWDYRSSFKAWIQILKYARIPHGVDHRDLGLHNAVRRKNGDLLVFDWEESVISCPFFSLERLLEDARKLDIENKKIKDTSLVPYSPMEEHVLAHYIKGMRWKHPKALTIAKIAIGVGHLKSTFETIVLRNKLGLPLSDPFRNFPLVLSRWQALKELNLQVDDYYEEP